MQRSCCMVVCVACCCRSDVAQGPLVAGVPLGLSQLRGIQVRTIQHSSTSTRNRTTHACWMHSQRIPEHSGANRIAY